MKDKITEEIEKTTNNKFVSAVEDLEWAEIGDIVERLDRIPQFWENVMKAENIRDAWKRSFVRRKIKQIRDNQGFPLFASIETLVDGEPVRVYKREDAFTAEDYKKAAMYHGNTAAYNGRLCLHYARGFEEKTGEQLILPFNPDAFVD